MEALRRNTLFLCLFDYEGLFHMQAMRRSLRQAVFKDEEGRLWTEANEAMVFAPSLGPLVFTGVS